MWVYLSQKCVFQCGTNKECARNRKRKYGHFILSFREEAQRNFRVILVLNGSLKSTIWITIRNKTEVYFKWIVWILFYLLQSKVMCWPKHWLVSVATWITTASNWRFTRRVRMADTEKRTEQVSLWIQPMMSEYWIGGVQVTHVKDTIFRFSPSSVSNLGTRWKSQLLLPVSYVIGEVRNCAPLSPAITYFPQRKMHNGLLVWIFRK